MSTTDSAVAQLRTLRILWGTMMMAPLFYAGVGIWLSLSRSEAAIEMELLNWVSVFLGLLSFLILLFVFLFRQITSAFTGGRYLNGCILRWAMVEGIAVFGVVLLALGLDLFLGLLFLIASIGGLALLPPSESEQQSYRELSQ